MLSLDTFNSLRQHFGIAGIHPAVAIDVVHAAVSIVVHEHVGGIAIHVTAQIRSPTRISATVVVARRAETAHDLYVIDFHALRLEILNCQLQLVDHFRIHEQVLRPDVVLVLGQKIAQAEMLRDVRVLVPLSDLDESRGRRVRAPWRDARAYALANPWSPNVGLPTAIVWPPCPKI